MAALLSDLLARFPDAAAADEAARETHERTRRVARAKADFFYFCTQYLPGSFPDAFAPYQRLILDIAATRRVDEATLAKLRPLIPHKRHDRLRTPPLGELRGLLDIEPREHGKTTRMSTAFPLWLALCREETFPVVLSASKESAEDLAETIIGELRDNERIVDDFGDQRSRRGTWSKRKLVLANGNALAFRGRGQSLRGIKDKYRRPTHVICDDLIKDNEAASKAARKAAYNWFKRVAMNLGRDAFILVVNTILAAGDLPSTLLQEVRDGQLANWTGLWFSALTPTGEPLWPQHWSTQALALKRQELGPWVWSTEWDNEPIAEEDRKFDSDWRVYFDPRTIDPRGWPKVMSIDPATGSAAGDDSAICILGKDPRTGIVYELDGWAGKESDLALVARVCAMYLNWRPQSVRWEDVAYQTVYRRVLAREASRQGINLPLRGVPRRINKQTRIQALAAPMETGVLQFNRRCERWHAQFDEFPAPGMDDYIDAMSDALEGLTGHHVGGMAIGQQIGLSVAQRITRLFGGAHAR